MIPTEKIRLLTTEEQGRRLWKSTGTSRFVYKRKYEKNKIPKGKEGEDRYKFTKTESIEKLENRARLANRKIMNICLNHVHQSTNEIVETKSSGKKCSYCGQTRAVLELTRINIVRYAGM